MERVRDGVQYLWGTPGILPSSVKAVLPQVNDTYVLQLALHKTFTEARRGAMGVDGYFQACVELFETTALLRVMAIV